MEFTFSQHALSRCIDMALDVDEIVMCLQAPQKTSPSPEGGCVYYERNAICAVVNFETKNVITVMWNRRRDDGTFAPRFDRKENTKREEAESWLTRRSRT